MSFAAVKEYFKQYGREQDVMQSSHSSATVELAAAALHVIPARIAKTLSFKRKEDGCILIVMAGDARVDNKKFKQQFGVKASMLKPDEVLIYTGHEIGGVCPFAINRDDVFVYLDESMKRFETIYPACGSGNSMIKLTCDELFTYAKALTWVNVTKDWNAGTV